MLMNSSLSTNTVLLSKNISKKSRILNRLFVSYGELRLFSCTEIWVTQFQFTSFDRLRGSNLACFWRFVVLIPLFLGSPFRHRFPTFQPPGESGRASVSAFTMIVTWHVGVLLRFTGRVKKRNAENKWKQMRKTGSWTGHARKKSVLTFATVAATAESCSRCNMPLVRGILPFFWATAWLSADDWQSCWNIMVWKTHKVSIN